MKFPCDFCRFVWTSISVLWITCQELRNNWPLPLPWVIGHSLGMGSSCSFHLRKMWKAWLFLTRSGSQQRRCWWAIFGFLQTALWTGSRRWVRKGGLGKAGPVLRSSGSGNVFSHCDFGSASAFSSFSLVSWPIESGRHCIWMFEHFPVLACLQEATPLTQQRGNGS